MTAKQTLYFSFLLSFTRIVELHFKLEISKGCSEMTSGVMAIIPRHNVLPLLDSGGKSCSEV